MNERHKILMDMRFREIAIRELKKAFPEDFAILEKDMDTLLKNRSLFEVKGKAQEIIAHHKRLKNISRNRM